MSRDYPAALLVLYEIARLLVSSLATSFIFAIAYVSIMPWGLDKTDAAYGRFMLFAPAVLPVMSIIASIIGLIYFPFVLIYLWRRNLLRAGTIILTTGMATIIVFTPIDAGLGFLLLCFFTFMCLIYCTFKLEPIDRKPPPGLCEQCGYDLHGHIEMQAIICPECGTMADKARVKQGDVSMTQ